MDVLEVCVNYDIDKLFVILKITTHHDFISEFNPWRTARPYLIQIIFSCQLPWYHE